MHVTLRSSVMQIPAMIDAVLDLVPDAPEDKEQADLKELQVARMALIKDRTHLLNRSKTQILPLLRRQSQACLQQVKRQLLERKEVLLDLLLGGPKRSGAFEVLCSITGLGRITAIAIIVECQRSAP